MIARRLKAGDDAAGAAQLLIRFFAEEHFDTRPEVITARLGTMLTLDTCGVFLAEAEGEAIGVATVSLEFGIEFGWWAEMGDLYVLPGWRGRGISRALAGAAETFLRSKGAAGYQVTVTPYASGAHGLEQFYQKLGFSGEGRKLLSRAL